MEVVRTKETLFIPLYCCIILWINASYLKEFKEIKRNLAGITSEGLANMSLSPGSLSVMMVALIVNFFRSWLLYLFAIIITEKVFVLSISIVLFGIGLYITIFNYSIEKNRNSNLQLYVVIGDTIYIALFVVYLFLI